MVELALASSALMLEFTDNVEGSITSPTLFQNYCMPFMQESADRIHAQGRYLGSHMDGNMESLLHLVPECGVDVVESFSPAPLTRLTFEDAWKAAKLISTWVYDNLDKVLVDSFTALDALHDRRGECQSHTNLFTALAQYLESRGPFGGGAVAVAAAGNESARPTYEIAVAPPAAATGIIAVGALGQGPDGFVPG